MPRANLQTHFFQRSRKVRVPKPVTSEKISFPRKATRCIETLVRFAQVGRKDVEFGAVFGHRAAGDLNALLAQNFHHLLIA